MVHLPLPKAHILPDTPEAERTMMPSRTTAPTSTAARPHQHHAGGYAHGAVMLGDEMIDEASRKMAQAIVARVTPPDSPTANRAEPGNEL
jgi:hypothetical protein